MNTKSVWLWTDELGQLIDIPPLLPNTKVELVYHDTYLAEISGSGIRYPLEELYYATRIHGDIVESASTEGKTSI